MKYQLGRLVTMGAILLAGTAVASAEGVQLTPGKWQTTTTMKMPMMAQEQTQTSVDCVTETEFTPEKLMENNDNGCRFTDIQVQGNTMSWQMECPEAMGNASGAGEFTATGDTASGNMRMNMLVEGQSMAFETRWQGKRLGACD